MRCLLKLVSWLVVITPGIAATGGITIDSLVRIKHPSTPLWSPDSRYVAYVWDEGGIRNLYVVSAAGGVPAKLTSFAETGTPRAFWSNNSKILYFEHAGGLWEADPEGHVAAHASAAITAKGMEFTPSQDGSEIAWVQPASNGVDLAVSSFANPSPRVLAHNDASIRSLSWSPDGRSLTYLGDAKVIHHDEAPAYSGAKIIYRATERTRARLYLVAGGKTSATAVEADEELSDPSWVDSKHVVFETLSKDFKTHSILIAAADGRAGRKIQSDTDAKFWSMPYDAGSAPQASPDGKWLMFMSDRDGWDHIYVMPSQGGATVQVTSGPIETWRPHWSPDSRHIVFDANLPDRSGVRQIYVADLNGDPQKASVHPLTFGEGTNIDASWSPNGKAILYQHTDTQHSADLFVTTTSSGSAPVRLTNSMPDELANRSYVKPEFVHFTGAGGQQVPGWLFLPENLDRSKKHPAIVWIHGDGINQNYDGWHVERNYAVYYSFHQYLLEQGYVVFAPDYRGSTGYGRDWRQGVYMDAGGSDAKDAWMAGKYLASLPYVDSERMGVWGLSYGGFFTLIAVTDQPTLFRAGVDVAGVVDYRMYYTDPYHGGWTVSRIGTPEQNPQVYDNASPLSHIDRLARPLLVLHGTADLNVPYLESVRLIDESLKQGKGPLIDFMMYPGEFHYFDREHVLRDAWRRVDEFFGKNVRDYAGTETGK